MKSKSVLQNELLSSLRALRPDPEIEKTTAAIEQGRIPAKEYWEILDFLLVLLAYRPNIKNQFPESGHLMALHRVCLKLANADLKVEAEKEDIKKTEVSKMKKR